jgi:membrane protease YdiL (CAAX protease family)
VAGLATDQKSLTEVSAVTLQDLWLYGVSDTILEEQRADRLPYVPEDTMPELVAAPFNGSILTRPEVLLPVPALVAAGMGVSMLAKETNPKPAWTDTPKLFGADVSPGLAYPAAAGAFAATFEHVALAEETAFRGVLQGELARACGQACGWALGAWIFGAFHASNALLIDDPDKQKRYLMIGVPYLIGVGEYISGVYWADGYSLATTVAVHFWYDFLLSAVDFLYEPRNSMISAKMGWPF